MVLSGRGVSREEHDSRAAASVPVGEWSEVSVLPCGGPELLLLRDRSRVVWFVYRRPLGDSPRSGSPVS